MVGTAKDTGKRPKTRRKCKRQEEDYAFYVVGIADWEWAFSFGVDQTRFRKGPYMDFRHLHLRGQLIVPSSIRAEMVELILMPERIDSDARNDAPEPSSVGSVSLFRGRFEALLTIPDDALAPVLQMLIADRFRYIAMHGAQIRHRRALIRSYRLETNIDEEDMPPDL
jgi:hypothetical protein